MIVLEGGCGSGTAYNMWQMLYVTSVLTSRILCATAVSDIGLERGSMLTCG